MSKILISGIHGFVGSSLVLKLKDKFALYGLDIVDPKKDSAFKTYNWADLDNNAIPKVDIIIHLAGIAHDTKSQLNAQSYFDINTGLTKLIYDYFLKSSASKFIFFSSVKAAAYAVSGDILTEDVIPAPKGPYAESKIAAENYIQANLPISNDKSVYIIRPCMIHGPGNKGNLNLLYSMVGKGIPWPLGAYENKRSFTSMGNLCYVIQGLISKDVPSGIYNMADDEPLSTNELVQVISDVKGRPRRIWKLNRRFMAICAKMGSFLHLPFNTIRLKKLTENYVVSNEKIKKALGIEKMPVTAREGLKKTLLSFEK